LRSIISGGTLDSSRYLLPTPSRELQLLFYTLLSNYRISAALDSVSREYSRLSAVLHLFCLARLQLTLCSICSTLLFLVVQHFNITTDYLVRCDPFYLLKRQLPLCYAQLCPTVQHYIRLSTALRSTLFGKATTNFLLYLLSSVL
jgi:hypothetical protein